MTNGQPVVVRPLAYVVAAALLGLVVGYLQTGSIGGALALAFAIGVGVALGILGFELWRQRG